MIIAQLSDIHADGSREALDRLDRVLKWLRPVRPDWLIVSGDLAEAEQRESYAEIRERFEDLGSGFSVVPGNVDDREKLRGAFGDLHDWVEAGPLNSSVSAGDLRLVGLDVTVPGAHHGEAGQVLDWLKATLPGSDGPTIIFQHQHPFLCGIDGKDKNICRSGDELADVINQSEAETVLLTCGHVHRPLFTQFAGRPATMAPSVARANKLRLDGREPNIAEPPGLLLHHWSDERLVSHVVMVTD
jgi:Icc protein